MMYDAKQRSPVEVRRPGDASTVVLGALAIASASAWVMVFERYGLHGFSTLAAERLVEAFAHVHEAWFGTSY